MVTFSQSDMLAHEARMNRGIKTPVDTDAVAEESDLHSQIINHCLASGWIYLHGSMSTRTSRTLGEPDFIIIASLGRVFFVECKSKSGKLSPAQQNMIHHARCLDTTIHVVRSIREFLELTK